MRLTRSGKVSRTLLNSNIQFSRNEYSCQGLAMALV